MNELHSRILTISKRMGLSHLGSCLTAVDIIDKIYLTKKCNEPFILSCGHAGLALYVVLEKYYKLDAEKLFATFGTHPDRSKEYHIDCSTGSLGHGLGIAVGLALADHTRRVYCLISDGECFEGSIWEAANTIRKFNIRNLHVHLNYNGFSAYDKVDRRMVSLMCELMPSLEVHYTDVRDYGLEGIAAHYVRL